MYAACIFQSYNHVVQQDKRVKMGVVEEGEAEVARVAGVLEEERGKNAAEQGEMVGALKALGEAIAEHQKGLREALGDATNVVGGTGATPILSRLSMAGGRLSGIAAAAAASTKARVSVLAVPERVEEEDTKAVV